jgi:hypothetical protein
MARDLSAFFGDPTQLVSSAPLSLDDIGEDESEQDLIRERFLRVNEVDFKVDYSSFSNHVFFNSALDYFNLTGEKILNEYPFDGDRAVIERFVGSLDGYQRHVLATWPARLGHLVFNPAVSSSYVQVEDVGLDAGVTKTSLMSPGTGSLSIEAWYSSHRSLTGSDVSFLAHKAAGDGSGFSLFLSASNVCFRVTSGSSFTEVACPASIGSNGYVLATLDRSQVTGTVALYTGSIGAYPALATSSSVSFGGPVQAASASLFIGSGSLSSKTTVFYSGTLDDVRIWRTPMDAAAVTSSYNRKNYARSSLVGLWRFNETGSSPAAGVNSLVLDHSGHKLNGRIRNYYSGVRGSGSLFYERPDPILDIRMAEVEALVLQQQTSASLHDKENNSKITDLVPEHFMRMDDEVGNDVLKNFLYIIARSFDSLKVYADQASKLLRVGYGDYDQAPDAALDTVARFFGWDLGGSFVNSDAVQYMLGRDVLDGPAGNDEIEDRLHDIKVQFWRRVLVNLPYIYKTKGTAESVRALMRAYGVNEGFVRLKEFGFAARNELVAQRIRSERSSYSLALGTGSLYGRVTASFSPGDALTTGYAAESRFRFPTTGNLQMPATATTGTMWSLLFSGGGHLRLDWQRDSLGSQTGSLFLSYPGVVLTASAAPVFDDRWYTVSVVRELVTGSLALHLNRVDDGALVYSSSSLFPSSSLGSALGPVTFVGAVVGSTASRPAEQWIDEFKVWKGTLSDAEIEDHALNYVSFGRDLHAGSSDLLLHWRLDEGSTAAANGYLEAFDNSLRGRTGLGAGFVSGTTPSKKFLNEYNYIGSIDFGWTQNKVRVFDGSRIQPGDRPFDSTLFSLEFNMVDALNEAISQMMSSFDEMNDALGLPSNYHRHSYEALASMRKQFFRRLTGRIDFRRFADLLEFFDRSFISLVRRLIPARSSFVGDEFVVESHMLERPKVEYSFRPVKEVPREIGGVLKMIRR